VDIIVPRSASAAEEYAAEELRRHLHAICGVGPQFRSADHIAGPAVHVNDRGAAEAAGIDVAGLSLGPESFHLETRGGEVYILGGGPRGVLYGVYELLETLGCRWYTPELTYLPRRADVTLPPQCRTESPAFEFRDMLIWESFDPVWRVRSRINGNSPPVPQYMGGHVLYHLFVHTFGVYVPPDEFFASHPEYFSFFHGRRQHVQTQLCLTNPDVLRIVTQRVLQRMTENPGATLFSISQNDWSGYCECPACAAIAAEEGSQAGPILRFVNAVAAETAKVFPDKLIDTLAYAYSLDAPRRVRPHRNVRVRLCSINCCQSHGLGRCDHAESRRFHRALEGWSHLTDQMYIWHYITNFLQYPQPVPNLDEMHYNIGLYHKFGVCGLFMQGMGQEGGGAESSALRAYVLSRLMWKPDQDVWPIVDEFLSAYYGPAAASVRQYLDLFHQPVRDDPTLHLSLYESPKNRLFDGDILARADAALAAGQKLAKAAQRKRVVMLRHGLSHVRLYRAAGVFRRDGDSYHGDATPQDLRDHQRMMRDFKAVGVRYVEEINPLEVSEQKARNRLSSHRVVWLREGEQQIAVVPGLGGRLVEWHAFGRQWLVPPSPEFAWRPYPAAEGYDETIYGGHFFGLGSMEPYRCRRTRKGLTLSADLRSGLRISRSYVLRDGALHIASRVANTGSAPRKTILGCQLHLLLEGPLRSRLRFATGAGEKVLTYDELPEGHCTLVMEGEQMPLGCWQVELPPYRITHSFRGEPMVQAIVGKILAWRMLGLDLKTDQVALARGQAIEVRQTVQIEQVG